MQGRIHTFLMAITHRPAGRTFFFFNDTATPEFYTLSLHDALPISSAATRDRATRQSIPLVLPQTSLRRARDRKSPRLNSSHVEISYAVLCLKKKKKQNTNHYPLQKKKKKNTIYHQ